MENGYGYRIFGASVSSWSRDIFNETTQTPGRFIDSSRKAFSCHFEVCHVRIVLGAAGLYSMGGEIRAVMQNWIYLSFPFDNSGEIIIIQNSKHAIPGCNINEFSFNFVSGQRLNSTTIRFHQQATSHLSDISISATWDKSIIQLNIEIYTRKKKPFYTFR